MNGVEILSSNVVYAPHLWVSLVAILAFIVTIFFAFMFCRSKSDFAFLANLICMVICMATWLTFAIGSNCIDAFREYDHTAHKVTIDDSVSMNEFLDKYEILDQEGKIYTVKERE